MTKQGGLASTIPALSVASTDAASPPAPFMNILGELRIPLEYGALMRSDVWRGRGVRRGDGERVLAIPGLLVGDETLHFMRAWLSRLGYDPLLTGIRSNVRCSERVLEQLEARLERAVAIDGRRAHVIGQSRGGMLAHVLAVRRPDLVASVTTLGSPINGTVDDFHPLLRRNLTWLSRVGDARHGYIATSCWVGAPGRPVPDTDLAHEVLAADSTCCEGFWPDLARELPDDVVGTAVYSRSDGIVRPKACIAPRYRAVEIRASHVGMATSSQAYHAIADTVGRAARDEGKRPRRATPPLIERRRLRVVEPSVVDADRRQAS
jgi:triacylglycerol lipase